jgi:Fe-S-cluster-containing dehydrogenase component/mono/diheme cytochrome c family protein
MPRMQMLIDLQRCIGCDACTVACKQENGTPLDTFFARVLNVEAGTFPNVKRLYIPVLCNHCEEPACLKACPNKAIFRREDGIVLIDQDRCKGMGACVSACPYGNIILTDKDAWYLDEEEPYERDVVKPRLKQNAARKCTYCAHRVDEGLKPACVVACPTNARIFGDAEDPESDVSRYVAEQRELTNRDPFVLLPQAKTKPTGCYLGPMASQETAFLEPAEDVPRGGLPQQLRDPRPAKAAPPSEPVPERVPETVAPFSKLKGLLKKFGVATVLTFFLAVPQAWAQDLDLDEIMRGRDLYSDSSCAACHEGGIAPSLKGTKMDFETFLRITRKGIGMMQATPPDELPNEDVHAMHAALQQMPPEDGVRDIDPEAALAGRSLYSTTHCAACHQQGMGKPLAGTTLDFETFLRITREGKGMMPATPAEAMSDEEVEEIYNELIQQEFDESMVSIAFKVGNAVSTRNAGIFFLFVSFVSLILMAKVLFYWLGNAGLRGLWPSIRKFGLLRSAWVVLVSLVVDGLFVRSLWRASKHRWFMHGLLLYGFLGLMLADVFIQIFNPTRSEMALTDPLKLFPILAGVAVLTGVFYVMYRYRSDPFIDNGVTLSRDFLFLNLLFHAVFSGFLSMAINRGAAADWVMPVYLYHLGTISLFMLAAPFTRFSHVFVVPAMAAMTRLTGEIARSGVEIGFEREPSPGRHHKSQRIALDVMKTIDPTFQAEMRLRYYP